jgi:hypothetical protein
VSNVQLESHEETPHLVDFTDAELRRLKEPGDAAVLRVRGEVPCWNMVVRLVPLVYIQQPDYWVVHVIGDLRGGICLDAMRDYDEILAPAPLGKRGVTVVGKGKREQLDWPG